MTAPEGRGSVQYFQMSSWLINRLNIIILDFGTFILYRDVLRMSQIDFADLETHTIELVEVCEKLTEENRKLRIIQSELLSEKHHLQEKIQCVTEKVSQLLSKLRVADETN